MDPLLQSLLTGVVANGLTAILAQSGHTVGSLLFGATSGRRIEESQSLIDSLLHEATTSIAERIEWQGPPRIEEVCLFLASPEVESCVRQIFAVKQVIPVDDVTNLEAIRQEFLMSFSAFVEMPSEQINKASQYLFDSLVQECDAFLVNAIENNLLIAHEARAQFRHRMLLDSLAAINKKLAIYTNSGTVHVPEILNFELAYRHQVAARHRSITPPHPDTRRKVPIDDIYVAPCFTEYLTQKESLARPTGTFTLQQFLGLIYRTVVLGNPGAGKSTLTLKLCHDLAAHHEERLLAGRLLTPILVVLRDYGVYKKEKRGSILQFVESVSNSHYQIPPPGHAFEYLMLHERVLVIFDGLDELLETSYRQEISGDVESFCARYPTVPVLVTSREVGYDQAPLDETQFETFRLAPFDVEQVGQYATKWFALDADITVEQRERKVNDFLTESRIVSDLRSNPLMLGLMCNLYRGDSYIPRNRPDIYEKCANLLFDKWDRSRGIHVNLPFEAHINSALKFLAYSIYEDIPLQSGVEEQWIVSKAAEYLLQHRFDDYEEAVAAASEFVGFCHGRAWVFTDTGSTSQGHPLYQFTHRTFLEYFSAAYLVRTNRTPEQLMATLKPRIAKKEWDVVAQLAFQLQSKNLEGADSELLSMLLEAAESESGQQAYNLVSFATRSLQFLVPAPYTTRRVAATAVQYHIEHTIIQAAPTAWDIKDGVDGALGSSVLTSMLPEELATVAEENRANVAESIERTLIDHIRGNSEVRARLALEWGLDLQVVTAMLGYEEDSELYQYWRDASRRMIQSVSSRLKELAPTHRVVGYLAFLHEVITINEFIEQYGFEALYDEVLLEVLPVQHGSIVTDLLYRLLGVLNDSDMKLSCKSCVEAVRQVGRTFTSAHWSLTGEQTNQPWSDFDASLFFETSITNRNVSAAWRGGTDTETLFGAFILLAPLFEVQVSRMSESTKQIADIAYSVARSWLSALPEQVLRVLSSRFESIPEEQLQTALNLCGWKGKQRNMAIHWVRHELNFVSQSNDENSTVTG